MLHGKRALLSIVAAIVAVLGTAGLLGLGNSHSAAAATTTRASASSTTRNFLVTLYGWPDNSPPGNDIAYPANGGYPTLHNVASGTGTYSDPITYATDKAELPIGTKVYYPYLHRYFIMEDDCVECDQDWTGQGPDGGPNLYHIDLWINGQNGNSTDVINCEDALTQNSEQVIINPPPTEPVDTTPLYNSSSNTCYDPSSFNGGGGGGGSYPSGYHQLVDQNSGNCLDVYNNGLTNGTKVQTWSCKSSGQANQEFQFNPVSNGYGELQNQNSGKDIVVQSASTSAGALIIQYTQNGTSNGLWEAIPLSDGTWQFKNLNSGLCLDVTGASTSVGTQLDQWSCKSSAVGSNQAFATS